jgi:surface antigen
MSFLKSFASAIAKPIAAVTPSFLKKPLNKVDAALGGLLAGGAFAGKSSDSSSTTTSTEDAATIAAKAAQDQATADLEAQKRMARLGKYFTSPTNVLDGASSASQKVFS